MKVKIVSGCYAGKVAKVYDTERTKVLVGFKSDDVNPYSGLHTRRYRWLDKAQVKRYGK